MLMHSWLTETPVLVAGVISAVLITTELTKKIAQETDQEETPIENDE